VPFPGLFKNACDFDIFEGLFSLVRAGPESGALIAPDILPPPIMISRQRGLLSPEFLIPTVGLLFSVLVVETLFATLVRPRAEDLLLEQRVRRAQGATASEVQDRSIILIIKDPEQEIELMFCLWGMIILTYKFIQTRGHRRLLGVDFVKVQPGERIIPDDALDRYKDLRSNIERQPTLKERLLPECLLAALHRFHATGSIQDAAMAIKDRSELAADELDSSLSLVRYIAWAIPAIGFIGTVRGIGGSLSFAEEAIQGDISQVTNYLGIAFNSTFVGLVLSIFLMYVLHLVQSRQEALIIDTQTYCRDRLIDIMKVPSPDETAGIFR